MQVPINSLKRKMFQILYLTLVYKIMRLRAPAHTAVRYELLPQVSIILALFSVGTVFFYGNVGSEIMLLHFS